MPRDRCRRGAAYRIYDETDSPFGAEATDLLEGESSEAAALSEQMDLRDLSLFPDLPESPAGAARRLAALRRAHGLMRVLSLAAVGGCLGLMAMLGVRSMAGVAPVTRPRLAAAARSSHRPRPPLARRPARRPVQAHRPQSPLWGGRATPRRHTALRVAAAARAAPPIGAPVPAPSERDSAIEFGFEG
jgi:hypothetical protein